MQLLDSKMHINLPSCRFDNLCSPTCQNDIYRRILETTLEQAAQPRQAQIIIKSNSTPERISVKNIHAFFVAAASFSRRRISNSSFSRWSSSLARSLSAYTPKKNCVMVLQSHSGTFCLSENTVEKKETTRFTDCRTQALSLPLHHHHHPNPGCASHYPDPS